MWVRKVEIENAGPFKSLSLDLVRGSVGVFGPNGSGKSTLVNMIYGAITNDFGRFPVNREKLVRNTAGPKDPSFVRVAVEHNGQTLLITRNFKPTRANPGTFLQVGGEGFGDTNKAQDKIREVLGADAKLLDLYVFKEQDKIYDFLTTTPTERAKAYATLCRTTGCEDAWTMFGEFLNKDREVNAEVVDNSDELAQAVAAIKEELGTLAERREQAAKKLCEDKWLARYTALTRDEARRDTLREQLDRTKPLVEAAARLVRQRQENVEEAEKIHGPLAAAAAEGRAAYDDTRAALKAWGSYRVYRKRRKALRDEADALAVEGGRNPAPTADCDVTKERELRIELHAKYQRLEKAQQTLFQFSKTGVAECPTCHTPVADLKDHLAELEEAVKTLPKALLRLETAVHAIETYQASLRKYEKWKAGYDARLKANADARAALQAVTAPDGDEEALQAAVREFDALGGRAAAAAEMLEKATDDLRDAEAGHKARREQVAELEAEVNGIELDPEKLAKAKRRLAEHTTATAEVAELDGEARGLRKRLADKEDELKRLRTRLKRSRRVRLMAGIVSRARAVLHRDALPRRVAATNLARMEGDVNENLRRFGDPYTVETDGTLSFVATKPGEPPQPAACLSTGQRVVLALAFWPAVASLWAAELGMLALDEPTANLDADNRRLLKDALLPMAAEVRGQRQLLLVTHDPELRGAFDQVVDLGVGMPK